MKTEKIWQQLVNKEGRFLSIMTEFKLYVKLKRDRVPLSVNAKPHCIRIHKFLVFIWQKKKKNRVKRVFYKVVLYSKCVCVSTKEDALISNICNVYVCIYNIKYLWTCACVYNWPESTLNAITPLPSHGISGWKFVIRY